MVDWLLLLGVNRICDLPFRPVAVTLAAILGALHAGLSMTNGFSFLGGVFWRTVFLCVMGLFAFDFHIIPTARFVLISTALGGVVLSMGMGQPWETLLSAGILIVLCFFDRLNGQNKQGRVPVKILTPKGEVSIIALRDTGNCLLDPLTGKQVLVASASVGSKLLGITFDEICDPVSTVARYSGYRLMPYHTVGNSGLLLAKNFKNVTIAGKTGNVLIAFAPNEIGAGKGFQALTGGTV